MLLIVLAHPLIEVVLTEKWLPTVPYIQIFSLNFMLYAVMQQTGNPVAAIGHSDILLKFQIVKRILSFAILIITIRISVTALCWGIFVSSVLEVIINMYVLKRELGIGFLNQVKPQIDVVLLVLLEGIFVYALTMIVENSYLQLTIGGTLGILVYLIATYIFNLREKEMIIQWTHKIIERRDNKELKN